jgi:hypothetical protein
MPQNEEKQLQEQSKAYFKSCNKNNYTDAQNGKKFMKKPN